MHILSDEIGLERHIAAEVMLPVILLAEYQVCAQGIQPLPARECPKCEGILCRCRGPAVVDGFVRIIEGRTANPVQGRHQQFAAGKPGIVSGTSEHLGRNATIDEAANYGLGVVPKPAAAGCKQCAEGADPVDLCSSLEVCLATDRPADQTR